MKSICNSCQHQEADNKGGVRCSVAEYKTDYHSSFKQGSVCIYDDDLNDRFLSRDRDSTKLLSLSGRIDGLQTELVSLRHENSVLKERLTKVGE